MRTIDQIKRIRKRAIRLIDSNHSLEDREVKECLDILHSYYYDDMYKNK